MAAVLTIALSGLRFHAFHGLYAEEKQAGNFFRLDADVSYSAPEVPVTRLEETLDYAALFSFFQAQMKEREDLLETWVMKAAAAMKDRWPLLQRVSLRLTKEAPPIPGFDGQVTVCYEESFK